MLSADVVAPLGRSAWLAATAAFALRAFEIHTSLGGLGLPERDYYFRDEDAGLREVADDERGHELR